MVCVLRFPLSVAIIALMFVASSTYGQWQKVGPQVFTSPDPQKGCAISYADGVVWAGGHSLWRSDDLGLTWQLCSTFPANNNLVLGIYFFDKLNGYVLSNFQTFITSDAGATWAQLPYRSSRWGAFGSTADTFYFSSSGQLDVCVKGISTKQIIGTQWISPIAGGHGKVYYLDNSVVFSSQNGGASWVGGKVAEDDCNALAIDSCDPNTIYLVNEEIFIPHDGITGIFVSHDDGATWSFKNKHGANYYSGDLATSKYGVYAQTIDGIIRSTDKGDTWISIGGPTGPPDNLSLAVVADSIIVAIDSFGNMWRTENDGGNPCPHSSPATITVSDVKLKDTIGQAVWMPIIIKHDVGLGAVAFRMSYDTSSLVFEHFVSSDGTPITLEAQLSDGVVRMLYHAHGLEADTLYALFDWYPTTQSSTDIQFDSILPISSASASCAITINPTAMASVTGHIYCETPLFSQFMRYNEPPYFSIQPNPATSSVAIRTNFSDAELTLSDALGRAVTDFNSVPKQLDVSSLSSGLYYLHFQIGRQHITRPLIIAH
jgi:photosystem II stability/assembly factor-like uncharacterized protein